MYVFRVTLQDNSVVYVNADDKLEAIWKAIQAFGPVVFTAELDE